MAEVTPNQVWWTAAEIAAACLPDLPRSRQGLESVVKKFGWRSVPELARRRSGRGGGWEYHWTLFPMRAQKKLSTEAVSDQEPMTTTQSRDDLWRWYDGLPEKPKDEAQRRLKAIQMVEMVVGGGTTKYLAVIEVAKMIGVSERTLWNWFDLIEGVRVDDRLPHLAPRHRAGQKKGPKVECDEDWWDALKGDYLRPERPSFSSSYRRAKRIADNECWVVLPERTARRRFDIEVSKPTQVLAREGIDALKAMYPPQVRDKTALHAMEAVNADFHRFDVFVRWPVAPGSDETEIVRPQMVAFQDIYSGRIVSWRVDRTPNKTAVSLALGDMIERFGIPDHVLLDNGREFANKFLTGQTKTRNRFKIKDDDIPGLLVALGCEIHWATPYAGQSKPIERAFRDMCDDIAKDPRFAGAYTGNSPVAHPENYGSRAIDLEDFLSVLADGIEEHNARSGRRSETANGRSFIETFDASYQNAPIRTTTEEQRRIWLMGAEGLRPHSKTGQITFQKNGYWAPWLHEYAGQKVVARFDPAELHAGLHLYSLANEYLGHVECQNKAGFFDVEAGRAHNRARTQWMKAEKASLEAARKMKVTEIAAALDRASQAKPVASEPVEAKVVRPVFASQARLLPTPAEQPGLSEAHEALIAEFERPKQEAGATQDDERTRFKRALEIEAALAAEKAVGREDVRWLESYQSTAEYKAQLVLFKDFGGAHLG